MKMNDKVEVLSVRYQFQWINSRINDEAFHVVFQVQNIPKVKMEEHMKNIISLLKPEEKTHFQSSREEYPFLAWIKLVTNERRLL